MKSKSAEMNQRQQRAERIRKDERGRGASSTTAASCPEKLYSSFSRLNVTAYFGDGQKCGDDDTEDWWGAGGGCPWQGFEVEMVKPDVA